MHTLPCTPAVLCALHRGLCPLLPSHVHVPAVPACPRCHQALPGGHPEAGLARATVEPPDLAVGMLLALGVWWGRVWGQAGTACQLLQRGAGHRVVLQCCAASGRAGIIPPVISVFYPTLPFLWIRNPWMAVRDLQLAVPRQFHSTTSCQCQWNHPVGSAQGFAPTGWHLHSSSSPQHLFTAS